MRKITELNDRDRLFYRFRESMQSLGRMTSDGNKLREGIRKEFNNRFEVK